MRCAGVRPVPLDIHVQGFDISNFESRMQARPLLVPVSSAHSSATARSKQRHVPLQKPYARKPTAEDNDALNRRPWRGRRTRRS